MSVFLDALRSLLVGALVFAASASPALSQTPGKPIILVLPFAPGSPTEAVGRWMAPAITERLKSPVVIENRSGAGGAIGVTSVANSALDGNTILFASNSITIEGAVKLKPAYDPLKDLRPITLVMYGALAVQTSSEVPANSLREFIAYAKANPGKLNYSHAGVGSFTHMAMELFKYSAGVDIVAVAFRGGAAMATATMGNFTQVMMLPPSNTVELVKTGKLKMLAVGAPQRLSTVPDLPTAAEAGLPGFEALAWYGLLVPAATPNDIFDRLERTFISILNDPDLIQKVQSIGLVTVASKSDQFRRQIEKEVKQWQDVVAKAGIPRE